MLSKDIMFRTNQITPVGNSLWWGIFLALPMLSILFLLAYISLVRSPAYAENEKKWVTLSPQEEAKKDYVAGRYRFLTVFHFRRGESGHWILPGTVSLANWKLYPERTRLAQTNKYYKEKLLDLDYFNQALRFATGYNSEMNRLLDEQASTKK